MCQALYSTDSSCNNISDAFAAQFDSLTLKGHSVKKVEDSSQEILKLAHNNMKVSYM